MSDFTFAPTVSNQMNFYETHVSVLNKDAPSKCAAVDKIQNKQSKERGGSRTRGQKGS